MQSKRHIAGFLGFGILIGFLVGGLVGKTLTEKGIVSSVAEELGQEFREEMKVTYGAHLSPPAIYRVNAMVSARHNLEILRNLRSEEIERAIESAEVALSSALVELGKYELSQGNPYYDTIKRTLTQAADYRDAFPHTSGNEELDDAVAKALSLVHPDRGN